MNAHFLATNPFTPRFKTRTVLPPIDLPNCPLKDARWVIVPFRCMMNRDADIEVIKGLVEQYGADKLVLFDHSDFGNGFYPCRVFAQNTKHDFPPKVYSYIDPCWQKFENDVLLPTPRRNSWKYEVTFVGDIKSHPCRDVGALELGHSFQMYHRCLFKYNDDGWVCLDKPQDEVYLDSFNTRLMWCPPSRRAVTERLAEALSAGVGIITNLDDFRKGDYLWFLDRIPQHRKDGMFIANQISELLQGTILERYADAYHKQFVAYREIFWHYILEQLNDDDR